MTDALQREATLSGAVPYELELLSQARNYQQWVIDSISKFLGSRILEVGSGTGNMSQLLPVKERLVLSEADPTLLPLLSRSIDMRFGQDARVTVRPIDLSSNWTDSLVRENFDTIVSFNVLEHIKDDDKAFGDLVRILRGSQARRPKCLVTFVPAHQWAYGAMDKRFGHYRRYSASNLRKIVERHAAGSRIHLRHFNVIGLPSWFIMGRLLRRDTIGSGAISTFERLCPFVRGIDDFLQERVGIGFGQSLICAVTLSG